MNFFLLKSYFPEFFLSICILLQLVYNGFLINNLKNRPIITSELFMQSFLILSYTFLLFLNLKCEVYAYNFLFVNDPGAILVKLNIVGFSMVSLIIVVQTFTLQKLNFFEFFILYLFTVFSSLLLVSVSDMVMGYLLLEMQALAFYVLAGFHRSSIYSVEAGIKYFIVGSFISSVFLIGCVFTYGVCGTLNFVHLSLLFNVLANSNDLNYLYYFAFLGYFFIVITFLLKLAVAPFHFWAPDVYDGAPLASTIILMLLPKLALVYFFVKWLLVAQAFFFGISFILECVGFLSVLVGTAFAIRQFKLKRLIIYSSIGQLGFVIISLSDLSINSLTNVFFFLIVYIIGSLAFWFFISNLIIFQKMVQSFYNKSSSMLFINSLTNGFRVNFGWSYAFIIIFSSFAGLPPFSGFFAKVFIIYGLIAENNSALIIFILFISLASAFYYLRLLKIIFYEPSTISLKNNSFQVLLNTPFFYLNCFVGIFLLFFIMYFFYNPTLLYLFCQKIVLGLYFF